MEKTLKFIEINKELLYAHVNLYVYPKGYSLDKINRITRKSWELEPSFTLEWKQIIFEKQEKPAALLSYLKQLYFEGVFQSLLRLNKALPESVKRKTRRSKADILFLNYRDNLKLISNNIETHLRSNYNLQIRQPKLDDFNLSGIFTQPIKKYVQLEKPRKDRAVNSFNDLFENQETIKPCLDVLRKIAPPVLDSNYEYIGGSKGIIKLWTDLLREKGLIKKCPKTHLKDALNQKFPNLKLGGSELSKHYKKVSEGSIKRDMEIVFSNFS